MSEEKFCDPCTKLLRGEREHPHQVNTHVTHHPDAKSFEEALRLPCTLCSLAWAQDKTVPPGKVISYLITPMNHDESGDDGFRAVNFACGLHNARLVLAPWQSMEKYNYPGLLARNTGSPGALNFLLSKYKECRQEHVQCGLRDLPNPFYPSRIIDVGEMDDENVCLRTTDTFDDEGPYFCLSHCWGEMQPYVLTKETEPMLRRGLPVGTLPKTFRDAIVVTRKSQVRYLWIDSLCIFQDDVDDWSTEASHMRDVYGQAACTIAATAAKNSDEGLFFERTPELLGPREIRATWTPTVGHVERDAFTFPPAGLFWCDRETIWTDGVERAPLSSRAWVAQERHLSSRTMHFGATQLFWECHQCKASECYPTGLPNWALPFWSEDGSTLKSDIRHIRQRTANLPSNSFDTKDSPLVQSEAMHPTELYHSWGVFRISYSMCDMTKEEDKLVAIQGIAKDVGEALGDQLVAGLWKGRILEELCWFNTYNPRRMKRVPPVSNWRAPTWSWASSNALIWISDTSKFHGECKQKQIWAELEDLDVQTKPSGALEYASMRVKCKPIRAVVKPGEREKISGRTVFGHILLDSKAGLRWAPIGPVGLQLYWDDMQQGGWMSDYLERKGTFHVHMLVIQRCRHDQPVKRYVGDCVEGLFLAPRDGSEDVFERIGLFCANATEIVSKIVASHEGSETKIITLV